MAFTLEDPARQKKRHVMHGKLGTVAKLTGEDGITRTYCWKLRGQKCILGEQRSGYKAQNFAAEAVYGNEETSPLIEIPDVLIRTLRIRSTHLQTSDIAVFFGLFAHARVNGFGNDVHQITLKSIADYLGYASIKRVKDILKRLRDPRSLCSYNLNKNGFHGRMLGKLVNIHETNEEIDALKSRDLVAFSFSPSMRSAVLTSKGYGYMDINALTRFRSKFTALVYMRLSYIAGQLECKRYPLEKTKAEMVDMLCMGHNVRRSVFTAIIDTIVRDLEAIDGPRRRFAVHVDFPQEDDAELTHVFAPSSAIRKLSEVKPLYVSKAVRDELESTATPKAQLFPLAPEERPGTDNILRAARLIEVNPGEILDQWRMSLRRDSHMIGMPSFEFKSLIRSEGILPLFEAFIANHDFNRFHPDLSRVRLEEQKPNIRPVKYLAEPTRQDVFVQCFSEPEEIPEYDILTAADMGFVEEPEDIPSQFGPPTWAHEVDDDEIDF